MGEPARRIRLTKHAAEAIDAKGILMEWVEQALTHPDWTTPDPLHPSVTRAYRSIPAFSGWIVRAAFRRSDRRTSHCHGRARRGHPRLSGQRPRKPWMAGTKPAKTVCRASRSPVRLE